MPSPGKYEVLGVGSPMLDQVIHVSHEFLLNHPGDKGGMQLATYEEIQQVLRDSGETPVSVPGGSASNTIKGLAALGEKCAFLGKIGDDAEGKKYTERMVELHIEPLLLKSSTPTGQVVCMITPDNERTFRSFQGAGGELNSADLKPEIFQGVRLIHIEGYSLAFGDVTKTIIKMAKEAGVKVSFDLACHEIAEQYKKEIVDLLTNHVDILFSNASETRSLTHMEPEKGCDILKDLCETVVVMMGIKGCYAARGDEKIFQPSFQVQAVDTTGAGDLFASGFLHGYLNGKSLADCARFGTLAASEVVKVHGAEIPQERWESIKKELK